MQHPLYLVMCNILSTLGTLNYMNNLNNVLTFTRRLRVFELKKTCLIFSKLVFIFDLFVQVGGPKNECMGRPKKVI